MSVSTKLYKIQRGKYILYIMMHTLCVAKSWIPTVFCALKVLSHDLTLCMCTACATTVVGRSLYHYPYVWDTNLPTTVSLPQSMKTGTGWKGWNSRKFPKFRAVVGSKISAYWTSLTIRHLKNWHEFQWMWQRVVAEWICKEDLCTFGPSPPWSLSSALETVIGRCLAICAFFPL